jgi:DNA-binding transcriptional ArsR family regulator
MSDITDDIGATVGHWNELVRRARLGGELKKAALVFSSYANADGTRVFCGVARLAVDCECSHRTAQRHLDKLRKVGLVELVRRGNRRRGLADEYRLILGSSLLDHVEIPSPAEYERLIDDVRQANKAKSERNYRRHHPTKDVDNSGSDTKWRAEF